MIKSKDSLKAKVNNLAKEISFKDTIEAIRVISQVIGIIEV